MLLLRYVFAFNFIVGLLLLFGVANLPVMFGFGLGYIACGVVYRFKACDLWRFCGVWLVGVLGGVGVVYVCVVLFSACGYG